MPQSVQVIVLVVVGLVVVHNFRDKSIKESKLKAPLEHASGVLFRLFATEFAVGVFFDVCEGMA